MGKNGLLIVLLLLFTTVLGPSNALSSRKLVSTTDPNVSSDPIKDSPTSTSNNDKKSNPVPVEVTKPEDAPITNPSNVESKDLNDANNKTNSENSADKKVDNKEKTENGKENLDSQTRMETFALENCNGNGVRTDLGKTMLACIQDFEKGSNNLTLAVKNEVDIVLKVNVTSDTSLIDNLATIEIPGHATKKVNFILSDNKTTKLILNGDCELEISQPKTKPVNTPPKPKDPEKTPVPKDENTPPLAPTNPKEPINTPPIPKEIKEPPIPKEVNTPATSPNNSTTPATSPKEVNTPATSAKDVDNPAKSAKDTDAKISENNFLDQLTFYSKQVTPMHGAYFAFFIALIVGASWALCTFRKRRNDGGIPYQELEMGLPESSNAVDVETTVEGWEQDWDDDDWDEDKAIRSPGGGVQTVSSNGLTSRKKDGWDADWDD